MIEIECLAHRGLWTEASQKNSPHALQQALEHGFGLETDLRDHGGTIVISHDPPGTADSPLMTLEQLFSLYRNCNSSATLALNVKADGLCEELSRLLKDFAINRYFVFDMSVPDMLAYTRTGLKCFSRRSELEGPLVLQPASAFGSSCGIWLDAFFETWYSLDLVGDYLASGEDVCLVSPELHGRDPGPWWIELKAFLRADPRVQDPTVGNLMLCTDYPTQFQAM